MSKRKGIILGAGIAGLGAYYADNELEIFEAEDFAGGLCSCFQIDNFIFDKAVHLSFSNINFVRNIFDETAQFFHYPEPVSYYHEKWLKHPAQNNLFPLSIEEKVAAVSGFVSKRHIQFPRSFHEWSESRYGKYLWENMFKTYNEKYWCVDLDELGVDWVGDRMYQPSLEEVLKGTYTDDTPNTYYVKEMRYPQSGGFYSYINGIVEHATRNGKLNMGMRAVSIDVRHRIVSFADGTQRYYDKLYSSIPLPVIVKMALDIPEELKKMSNELEHTGVAIASFGLKKVNFDKMWFYIYDSDIMASRAYMPSIKSKNNAPHGTSSIQFEIYFNGSDSIPSEKECIENCIYALEKMGICETDKILFSDFRVLDYGNVIMKIGTERIARELVTWLEDKGINCIGRFGRWEYLWSDQAFMSGYDNVKKHKNQ